MKSRVKSKPGGVSSIVGAGDSLRVFKKSRLALHHLAITYSHKSLASANMLLGIFENTTERKK